jgi:hypothetical protein
MTGKVTYHFTDSLDFTADGSNGFGILPSSGYVFIKSKLVYVLTSFATMQNVSALKAKSVFLIFRYFTLDSGVLYITKVQHSDAGTYR